MCRSTFVLPGGAVVPEFDRFGLFDWHAALGKIGKNLARVLVDSCAAPCLLPDRGAYQQG
jgi:hypothetical protein